MAAFRSRGSRLGSTSTRLGLEHLEDRRLLTTLTRINTNPSDGLSPAVRDAFERVSDLTQYTQNQISLTEDWVVNLDPNTSRTELASALGVPSQSLSGLDFLDDTFIVPTGGVGELSNAEASARLADFDGARYHYPLVPLNRAAKLIPNDPLFTDQWTLLNTGQTPPGGVPGQDVNITSAWDSYSGEGVQIAIVDDALQGIHPDLAANYRADLSQDYLLGDDNPSPDFPDEGHGTSVAGIAAGVGNNNIGVTGVAFGADIAGIRLLGQQQTDQKEGLALSHESSIIDISNNSWGPADFNNDWDLPGPLALAAIQDAALNDGVAFAWAAGNGADFGVGADVNYDGYANSIYTIAIGALDSRGLRAPYSEPGASLIAVAPSGIADVVTTDLLGTDGFSPTEYTSSFDGTSAATPVASGVMALMLEANSSLEYRDFQHIFARTSRMVDANGGSWQVNGAGFDVSHEYGFGAIDATAAVRQAELWSPVPELVAFTSGPDTISTDDEFNLLSSERGPSVLEFDFTATDENGDPIDDFSIEYVEVVIGATHALGSDLEILLTSPSGTESVLALPHLAFGDTVEFDDDGNVVVTDYGTFGSGGVDTARNTWRFTTTQNWGENPIGTWDISVRDGKNLDPATFEPFANEPEGTWDSVELIFYGTETQITNPVPPTINDSRITGEVFNDADGDGVFDAGESGVGGRVVFLDANGNGISDPGEQSTVTGMDGFYVFEGLASGSYNVALQCLDGFSQTTPSNDAPNVVNLSSGSTAGGVNFGTMFTGESCGGGGGPGGGGQPMNPGTISGRVFFDADNNGAFSTSDAVLDDVWVYLDMNDSCVIGTLEPHAIVQPDGTFTISNVPEGTYNLRVTPSFEYSLNTCDAFSVTIGPGAAAFASGIEFAVSGSTGPGYDYGVTDEVQHRINGSLYLGENVFRDDEGGTDTGDNDGVMFTTGIQPGETETVTVIANQSASAPGFLHGWIDYNGNGVFTDPGEQIFRNVELENGTNDLTFTVPSSGLASGEVVARFRWGWGRNMPPTGVSSAGEVEDYRVRLPLDPQTGLQAVDDTAEVDEDSVGNIIDVLSNDVEGLAGGLQISAVSDPTNGTAEVVQGSPDTISYTPDPNYFGMDTFTYTVTDSAGNSSSATVVVTVVSTNDPPIAVDDAFMVNTGENNVFLNVLSNDSDPDNDPLTITSATDPANGSVVIASSGILYTPDPGFSGTDTFVYTIEDPLGASDMATVTVTVVDANKLVRYRLGVTDLSGTPLSQVAVGQEFLLNVFVQDLRDNAAGVFSGYVDVTYNPAFASVTGGFTYGDAYPNAQKGDTSTAGLIDEAGAVDGTSPLGPDEQLLWSVPITASMEGQLDFASDPADILPANETVLFLENEAVDPLMIDYTTTFVIVTPALAGAVDDVASVESNSVDNVILVLDNDVPPAGAAPFTIIAATDPDNGTATINGNEILYTPDADFFGTDTFMYTVQDALGGTDVATVTVTVVEGSSPVANDDSFIVSTSSTNNALNVLQNDFDPDGEAVQVVDTTMPMNGSVTITSGGTGVLYTPDPGFIGTDTFVYTIQDTTGLSDTATVTVTVQDVDELVRYRLAVTNENGAPLTEITVGDTFVLNVFVQDLRDDALGVFAGYLDVTYDPTLAMPSGAFTYGPAYDNQQTGSIATPGLIDEAGAFDGTAPLGPSEMLLWSIPFIGSMPGTLNLAGDPADVLPAHETLIFGVDEGIPASMVDYAGTSLVINEVTEGVVDDIFRVDQNSMDNALPVLDNDVPPAGAAPFTLLSATDPANGTVAISGNNVLYTPDTDFLGTDTFMYTVEDANGIQSSATVTVTVTDPSIVASYELEITNLVGTPIDEVTVGDTFQLNVYTNDLRTMPQGVFAGYLDVLYSGSGNAMVSDDIVYGDEYPEGQEGTPLNGEIDELGAFDSLSPFGDVGRVLLATVTFTATQDGELTFQADPADIFPAHFTLVFGDDDPVDTSNITYGADTLTINPANGIVSPFTNRSNRYDVNMDGTISPTDAVIVINDLVNNGSRPLIDSTRSATPAGMVDVTADFYVSAQDALWIINEMNTLNRAPMSAAVGVDRPGLDEMVTEDEALAPAISSDPISGVENEPVSTESHNTSSILDLIDRAHNPEDEDEASWESTLQQLALNWHEN